MNSTSKAVEALKAEGKYYLALELAEGLILRQRREIDRLRKVDAALLLAEPKLRAAAVILNCEADKREREAGEVDDYRDAATSLRDTANALVSHAAPAPAKEDRC
jgi:hypothetical protein